MANILMVNILIGQCAPLLWPEKNHFHPGNTGPVPQGYALYAGAYITQKFKLRITKWYKLQFTSLVQPHRVLWVTHIDLDVLLNLVLD